MKKIKNFGEFLNENLNEYFRVPHKDKKFICPIDLYGGSISKGTIFVQMENEYYYKPEDMDSDKITGRYMPAEIVSTWKEEK